MKKVNTVVVALLLVVVVASTAFVYVSGQHEHRTASVHDSSFLAETPLCGDSGEHVIRAAYSVLDVFGTTSALVKQGHIGSDTARMLEGISFDAMIYAERVDRACAPSATIIVAAQ